MALEAGVRNTTVTGRGTYTTFVAARRNEEEDAVGRRQGKRNVCRLGELLPLRGCKTLEATPLVPLDYRRLTVDYRRLETLLTAEETYLY